MRLPKDSGYNILLEFIGEFIGSHLSLIFTGEMTHERSSFLALV